MGAHGLGTTLAAGWAQLVAPAFVALVLAAVVCERLWPAERRPLLARGHVQDACYLLLYALAIAPFMTLLSVGSAVHPARPRRLAGGGVDGALAPLDRRRGHARSPWTCATGWPTWATTASVRCGASTRCTTHRRS